MIRFSTHRVRTLAEFRSPLRLGNVAGFCCSSRLHLPSSMKVTDEDKKRIYVLGTSARAIFIAAGLGLSSKWPPVSLTTIDRSVYEAFINNGSRLKISQDGQNDIEVKEVQVDLVSWGPNIMQSQGQSQHRQEKSPILNLIWCTRARYAYDAIYSVRHRLSKESTVMFIQSGMGILERVMTQIFPDINSRPTFIQASSTQPLWQEGQERTPELDVPFDGGRHRENIFDVCLPEVSGQFPPELSIGPPVIILEDPKSQRRRIAASSYLIQKLLAAPLLNAIERSKREILIYQWRRLITTSVFSVLSVYYECPPGDVTKTTEGRQLCFILTQEAYNVLHRHLPSVPISDVFFWLQQEETQARKSKPTSRLLSHIKAGKELDIQFYNQWLVDRGKAFGLECPTHVRMINIAYAKLEKVRLELKREEEQRQRKMDERLQKREMERDEYRLDKVEEIRRKKAQRQKEMLGKQSMPSHIASPSISTLGNTQIEREPVNSRDRVLDLERSSESSADTSLHKPVKK